MNELKILKGDPIEVVDELFVYPLTLSEIADVGENVYNTYLSTIMTDKKILENLTENDISKEELNELYQYSDLEFIMYLFTQNPTLLYSFLNALKFFLKSEVVIKRNVGLVITNNKICCILTNSIFEEIKKVIIRQNFLKNEESTTFKPANDKARALLERLKKAKEKIQQQNKEEGLSLKEIISIVANYSNDVNIIRVWDLTINQLYESYLRLIVWDEYHNKFTLLPHSSDPQSLDIKHWAADINKLK